jgi:hypothetical protein
VATGVAKITGHAGREPAKVDSCMTVSCIDILVQNHGSIVLLRPATIAGREWLAANCDRSGSRRSRRSGSWTGARPQSSMGGM